MRLLLLVGLLGVSCVSPAQDWAGFESLIEREMTSKQAPGLAIAVVQNGKVVYSRAFGVRDVEKNLPVTPQTEFRIGSVTKSITAASAGILVQQGKLEWDKPVRDDLPDFRLQDDVATDRLTLRDMLTHRSGLPRHDMVWFHENLPRAEYVRRLRFLEPTAELRERFQYNNLIYTTAGFLVGEVAGTTWESVIQREIFDPLGMSSTHVTLDEFTGSRNRATGYGEDDNGKLVRIPDTSVDAIAPAGAVTSTLEDMTRYLMLYLNDGKAPNGREILQQKTLQEMQTPFAYIPVKSPHPEIGPMHYGFGLFVSSYRGHRHVYHTGAYEGFNASLAWLPDDKIGVVILANRNLLMNFLQVINFGAYDQLLGIEPIDWRARFGPIEPGSRNPAEKVPAPKKKPIPPGKLSRPQTDYVGSYEHPAYGTVGIADVKTSLMFRFHGDDFPLRLIAHDTFETGEFSERIHPLEKTRVTFQSNDQGDIASLSVRMENGVKPPVLTRVVGNLQERAVDAVVAESVRPTDPGMALGIYRGGRLVYSKGYGMADLEEKIRITPQTVFHVASVSKQFTAFSIALLAREGKVNLNEDVRTYLPWVPDFGQKITVRDLILHTSGLRDQWMLFVLAGLDTQNVLRQQQIVSMVKQQRALNFEPGTQYSYSNTGYTLLAEIVHAVSGKSLREFANERIFAPLGMTRTFFNDDVTEVVAGRAHSYIKRKGRWTRALLNFDNVGATSLFTTVEDLAKWAANFSKPVVGDAALIQQITAPASLRDGTPLNYAFALHRERFSGHDALMHYGSDAGFRAAFVFFPKEDFAVLMAANTPPKDQQRLIERIVDLYLNEGDSQLPQLSAEVHPDARALATAPGHYRSRYGRMVSLERKGDTLVYRTLFNEMPLIFHADGSFELSPRNWTYYRPFQFTRDSRSGVTGFTITDPLMKTSEVYSRAEPVKPEPTALAELAGDYRSPELDITYTLTVENGALVARALRIVDPMVFSPSMLDRFDTRMGVIEFVRDASSKPTGFRLHSTGVNNLAFARVMH